jgi:hypothetical protein
MTYNDPYYYNYGRWNSELRYNPYYGSMGYGWQSPGNWTPRWSQETPGTGPWGRVWAPYKVRGHPVPSNGWVAFEFHQPGRYRT